MLGHALAPRGQSADSDGRAQRRERFYERMFGHSLMAVLGGLCCAVLGVIIGISLRFLGSESSANLDFMGSGQFLESLFGSLATAAFMWATGGGVVAIVGALFLALALWKTKES